MNYMDIIHVGIVVQNDDPEKAGRVKVYIPSITNTVYDNWNKNPEDKQFNGIDGDLIAIIATLQQDLPWADRATALFGGDTQVLNSGNAPVSAVRPSDAYVQTIPTDAFELSGYDPGDYSESSAGMFSIPSVGSHVYTFFKGGNTNFPVYFAGAHSKSDWQTIFKDHYPTDYENSDAPERLYENKHVVNSTKHTLEFIDTDEAEQLKLSHYSGSNIHMTNEYTSEFAVNDHQKLVNNDEYSTVKNNKKTWVNGEEEDTVDKNRKTTIGIDDTLAIVQHLIETIGGNVTTDVGGNVTWTIGGNLTINVTGNTVINTTGKAEFLASATDITGSPINLN